MKLYALTEAGKVAAKREGDDEEMKVLHFIKEHRTATAEELEVVAGSYVGKRLVRSGLVKELTN